MKKKLSGALALGMALALTFSMTAFASGSTSTEAQASETSEAVAEDTEAALTEELTDDNGNVLVVEEKGVSAAVEATMAAEAEKTYAIGGTSYAKKAGTTPLTLDIFAYVAGDATKTEVDVATSKAVKLSIHNDAFVSGALYLVLHQQDDGTIEAVTAITDGNKTMNVTLHGLSPVTFVQVEAKAGDNNQSGSSDNSNPASSPKTGEALPVAGAAALICLAGVAVCAKKVKFNR